MTIRFCLVKGGHPRGPRGEAILEYADPIGGAVERIARRWAERQPGHPWDAIIVTMEDGSCRFIKLDPTSELEEPEL